MRKNELQFNILIPNTFLSWQILIKIKIATSDEETKNHVGTLPWFTIISPWKISKMRRIPEVSVHYRLNGCLISSAAASGKGQKQITPFYFWATKCLKKVSNYTGFLLNYKSFRIALMALYLFKKEFVAYLPIKKISLITSEILMHN